MDSVGPQVRETGEPTRVCTGWHGAALVHRPWAWLTGPAFRPQWTEVGGRLRKGWDVSATRLVFLSITGCGAAAGPLVAIGIPRPQIYDDSFPRPQGRLRQHAPGGARAPHTAWSYAGLCHPRAQGLWPRTGGPGSIASSGLRQPLCRMGCWGSALLPDGLRD